MRLYLRALLYSERRRRSRDERRNDGRDESDGASTEETASTASETDDGGRNIASGIAAGTADTAAAARPSSSTYSGCREFSVTVARQGGDLTAGEVDCLERWFRQNTYVRKFFMGMELGDTEYHYHAQAVVAMTTTSARKVNSELRKALGESAPAAATAGAQRVKKKKKGQLIVQVKELVQKDLHTFLGMVGYCRKRRLESYFKMFSRGVSQKEMAEGDKLYALYGSAKKGKEVVLTPYNVLDRAFRFDAEMRKKQGCINRDDLAFEEILLEMLGTQNFVLGPSWAGGARGSNAIDMERAQLVWKSRVHLERFGIDDLVRVIYQPADRVRFFDSWLAVSDRINQRVEAQADLIEAYKALGGQPLGHGTGRVAWWMGMIRAFKNGKFKPSEALAMQARKHPITAQVDIAAVVEEVTNTVGVTHNPAAADDDDMSNSL